ncbi:restriction endonuclease subunit S [uncultured Eubacterium sp.]|uniref:restriction endonuclease subunit S n=1 Tax=uncultured Eubacterium sp. TaxID=165185 RepID=UPI002599B27F|nr:restriction endonuclease subunit S [uncultured Eubacterium sp.]
MIEPKLRFPEFNDSWNKYKIENIFDRVGIPVELDDSQTYREIGIRSHGKGIFHKEETTATEIGNKRVFWVEPGCFVVNIVFAWERAVAKTTEKENGMIASHRFPMYKPKKDIVDLDYITEYFITKRGQNVLILASPGGAGRNKTLGQKEFAKSVVKLPSLPEQQKIAEFLSTIDTVITKQKENVSAWEERKKGVMQKLFSQEIRFKADDGSNFPEWEGKMLGEVFKISTETNGDRYSKQNVLSVSDEYGVVNQIRLQGRSFAGNDISKYKVVKTGQIIYTRSPLATKPFGIIKRVSEEEGIVSPLYIVNDVTEDNYSMFWYYNFDMPERTNNYLKPLVRMGAKHTMNISNEEWLSGKILVPCLAEQQKIADCLSSLDEVIEKQKATLSVWEELKKGLLQQMFV